MDKTSKLIVDFIKNQPNFEYKFNNTTQTILPPDEFDRCIQHMLRDKIIHPLYSNGIVIGYSLSHSIVHKKEFTWIAFKKYILHHWIAIIALIISIIDLILIAI